MSVSKPYNAAYDMGDGKLATVSVTEARKSLYRLVNDVAESHDTLQIVGKRNSAVLVSVEDWRAIQETLYLGWRPGMRVSIQQGLTTPLEECDEELDW
jgi:antitoxin YefM